MKRLQYKNDIFPTRVSTIISGFSMNARVLEVKLALIGLNQVGSKLNRLQGVK